jgi:hypothetical protein
LSTHKFSMNPKPTGSAKPKLAGPPVTIASAADGLALQVLDQTGGVMPGVTASAVTSTLTCDNPAVTITQVDSLTYTASIPAGTSGNGTFSATLSFVSGTPPTTFTASVPATLAIPPTPSTPTDIQIVITPSP